jgi:hypothetical protein
MECWNVGVNQAEGPDLPIPASAFNTPPHVSVDPSGVRGFGTPEVWGGVS